MDRKDKIFRSGEIDTERGKKKLHYDGRLYAFDELNRDGTIKFWRCEFKNSRIDKCKGRIWTTLEDEFVRMVTPHTCEQNPARTVAEVKTGMKRRAVETGGSCGDTCARN